MAPTTRSQNSALPKAIVRLSEQKQKSSHAGSRSSKRKAPNATDAKLAKVKRAKFGHETPQVEQNCGLLSLPAELRNEIYRLALTDDEVKHIRGSRSKDYNASGLRYRAAAPRPWREPPLLQVCKSVRAEASSMYYASHDFQIWLTLNEFHSACDWLRIVIDRCGNEPFQHLNFYVKSPMWKDLPELLPLAHLIADTNLKLEGRPAWRTKRFVGDDDPKSSFQICDPTLLFQSVLHKIARLGRRAWKKDWGEQLLDAEFSLWLEEEMKSGYAAEMMRKSERRRQLKRNRALGLEN